MYNFPQECFDFFQGDKFKIQAELYFRLVGGNLELNDYFNEQRIVDEVQIKFASKTSWPKLLLRDAFIYEHEDAHNSVYEKWGISTKLFRSLTGLHFVMDTNFNEVAKRNNFDIAKVVKVLSEMLITPYTLQIIRYPMEKEKVLKSCMFDIPCYEILQKNITDMKDVSDFKILKNYQ
jgi:hypothetical protein